MIINVNVYRSPYCIVWMENPCKIMSLSKVIILRFIALNDSFCFKRDLAEIYSFVPDNNLCRPP